MSPDASISRIHQNPFAFLRERLARRPDSEHGQALIRIVITSIALLYLVLLNAKHDLAANRHYMLLFVSCALLAAVGIFSLIVIYPQASPTRRVLTMIFDFSAMSYIMYAMADKGIVFFSIYLWVAIGYGLRYGVRYLYAAMVVSIASFALVIASAAYWREQWGFSIGLLIGLVALPLYFSGLLRQLGRQHSELKKLYEQTARHATHDSLTGLPNRKHFDDHLAETIVSAELGKKTFAVLYLDLDGFKIVNDDMGHGMGDQIIENTARRIEQCVRKGDMVARVGGDEFIVLLRDVTSHDACKVAEKITATLSAPFTIGTHTLRVTTSVGVATYPNDGMNATTLIHNADSAMYDAKRSGKNSYRICSGRLIQQVG